MVFYHHTINFMSNQLFKKTMKKEKLQELFDKLFMETRERKEIKLMTTFSEKNFPTIAMSETRRGRDWEDTTPSKIKINLCRFKTELEKLGKDEVFVFGRLPECDFRPELEEVTECFKKRGEKNAEENAEFYYLRNCRNVSRVHCFIQNNQNGTYNLYDCSLAGTVIVF